MKKKEHKPVIPVGTRVRFVLDKLGASRDKESLFGVTGETYGIGDEGVVAFAHPNHKMLPFWFYVEVDSKDAPGEKRYVGVSETMVEVIK